MRQKLTINGSGLAKMVAQSRCVPRLLLLIMAVLTLGAVAALARGPVFQNTNIISMAQGSVSNIVFIITDDAVGWSGITSTTTAMATNGAFCSGGAVPGGYATSILTETNFAAPYLPTNVVVTTPFSLETNRLTIAPGNQFGTNKIVLISTDIWGDSSTNTWTLQVYHVSQPPSFALATNNLVVSEESGRQTNHNFLTAITNGAGNPPGLTWTFSATTSTTTATNGGLTFLSLPAITNYNGTNGITADLVFAPAAHSFGSNSVTVVMTDSGASVNGGRISSTNTFELVVSHIVHPPVFGVITNRVMLENGVATNLLISVSGDAPGSALGLTVISTNLLVAAVTATNVITDIGPSTNTVFTLGFTNLLNKYGTNVSMLIASELVGNTTYFSTNYVTVTVGHVSQPPSFTLTSNYLAVLEESGAQTILKFATNIWSGAGNPTSTLAQLSFTVNTVTNAAGNAQFTVLPAMSTNGTLTFTPKAHSFGTNVVTVTLTDTLETTNYGGVKTFSQNFSLEVAQISHVPTISPVTAQTVLENGSGIYITNNVWNYDAISNNLALIAVSSAIANTATNMVTVTITATNVMSATNTQFTLHLVPLPNFYGTNVITVTASNLVGTTTTSSTNYHVVVTHVTQAPSFVFATNDLTTPEQAAATAITYPSFLTSITNGAGNLPPYTNWTFALTVSNQALFNVQPAIAHNGTLTFTPKAYTNGTSGVKVVMTDGDANESTANGGVTTFTTNFTIGVSAVSTSPTFAFATNTLMVAEESAGETNLSFVKAINPGLGKPSSTTWSFTTVTVTNEAGTNAQFTSLPEVATNGTLAFTPAAHSYGTNLVTVIMTDSDTNNSSVTNTFTLAVVQIAHAPSITWATNQTTLENAGALPAVINVWDYDSATNNLFLTALSADGSVAQVAVTWTNWISATNVQFTLALTPVTDAYGSSAIELTASEGTNGALQTATNFLLTVAPVSQPPSFAFSDNVLVVPENAGTMNINNFLTAITNGAGNPSALTWTFTVTNASAGPTNVAFAPFQSPTINPAGTLNFKTADYGYGTNTLTVVMTDDGGVVNGGVISYTNAFQLQVVQGPAYPVITGITNVALLENATSGLSLAFNLYDPLTTHFNVSCSSSDPSLVAVSVTGNNTNYTLWFAPATNTFGTNTFTFTADNGTQTNSVTRTVGVAWVNQAPSFALNQNSYTVDKYGLPVTIPWAVTNLSVGPANESSQTLSIILTNASNALLQTPFSVDPSSGTISFTPGNQGGTVVVGIQVHDTGGTANGGVADSAIQTFTINIPTNTLQNAAGTFTGLFYSTNAVALASSGSVGLTLADDGTFSGSLVCAGATIPASGQFSISSASAWVTNGNYLMNLTVDTTDKTIGGSVSNTTGNWSAELRGYLVNYGGPALDGAYTMSAPGFDIPAIASVGDSAFEITIGNNLVALTGYLADSNQVTLSSPLCTNGYSPVYQPLYDNGGGAQGLLIGWLNFTGVKNNGENAGSELVWISQAGATTRYPNGFTNEVTPLFSAFDGPQGQLLPINAGYIELSGGNLNVPIVEPVNIVNNQIIVTSPTGNGLNLTINTNTGEMQGSFMNGGVSNYIESVILQSDEIARGYFSGANQSGAFILVANAVYANAPPFPAFTDITPNGAMTVMGTTTPAGITNLVIRENADTNNLRLHFVLQDPVGATFTVTTASANSNLVVTTLSGSSSSYDLFFSPTANTNGSTTVTVTADDGTLTNTFTITSTISFVNQAPSFTLQTTAWTVDTYGTVISVPNAATGISAGPPNEAAQHVNFLVSNTVPGDFTVQPAIDGTTGTLTFTPASGAPPGPVTVNVWAHDDGGTANSGTNTSSLQTITITFPSNPFSSLMAGPNLPATFTGLFNDTAPVPDLGSSGGFSLVLTNDGTFYGYLLCAGASNGFSGQFNISSKTATAMAGNYGLTLNLDTIGETVTGTVVSTSPSWTANVTNYLAGTPATVPAGTYLVVVPGLTDWTQGPMGDSILSANISPTGLATLTGYLADGTAVSTTNQLSAAGNCPVYIPLYGSGSQGMLFGWLTFTNDPADNVTSASSLTWVNSSGATPLSYPAGFTNQTVPVASVYTTEEPALTGLSFYAVLTGGCFGGGSPVTNAVTIVGNTITVDPSATNTLSLTINTNTGLITGTFVDTGANNNNLCGLVLQNNNDAFGFFTNVSGTQAGSFALLPNYTVPAANAYPWVIGLTNVTLYESNTPSIFQMAFTMFDPLTTNISVSATSSNAFVTVLAGNTGTAGTLSIQPMPNTYTNGVAIILTATDGTLSSTNTIQLTVKFVNEAPSFGLNINEIDVTEYDVPVSVSQASAINIGGNQAGGTLQFYVSTPQTSLFTSQPAIAPDGTLTFTPGSVGGTAYVSVYAQNSMGTMYGGHDTSTTNTFTIVLPENRFQDIVGANPTASFTGLFYDPNDTIPTSSGYVALTLTNDGTFSVNLVSVGATNSGSGQFSISSLSTNVAVASYVVGLTLDPVAGTVMGTVSNTLDTWNVPLQTYLTTNPVVSGYYTVTLPGFDDLTAGPIGYSVFTVGISTNGLGTLSGFMADNTPVSQAVQVSAAAFCPIYIPLYANGTGGLLMGWLNFTNDPAENLSLAGDSVLTWFNAAGATPNLFADGFTNQQVCLASPYATNSPYATAALGSSSSGFGYAVLSGGNLGADPVVEKVGITNNVISVISSKDRAKMSLNINTNTGYITGWYLESNLNSNNIEGAIFQNGVYSAGYFYGANTNECGLFMLYGE